MNNLIKLLDKNLEYIEHEIIDDTIYIWPTDSYYQYYSINYIITFIFNYYVIRFWIILIFIEFKYK